MQKEREQVLLSWLRNRQLTVSSEIRRTTALGVGQYIFIILQSALLAWIAHQIVINGTTVNEQLWAFSALIFATLMRALCSRGRELAAHRAGEKLRRELRAEILDRVAEQGPAALSQRPSGSWLTLLMEQVDKLHDFYGRYLPQMQLVRILPLLTLLIVFPFSWAAALILLLTAPLIVVFMILVGNRAAAASRRHVQALSRLSAHFLDRLQGLPTLRLFYRSREERAAVGAAAEAFREKTMKVLRLAFLSSTVLEFFTAIAIALTAMYLGMSYLGYLDFGLWGEPLTLFTGLFLLLLAPEYYLPLRELGTYYHAKADAIGAADELHSYLESPQPHFAGGQELCPVQAAAGIEFRDVSVVTESGRRILEHISFVLEPGKKLAIVGHSGAGKTTLLNALLGFTPFEGEILVNGVSLHAVNLQSWRTQIGWLGQNPKLFHGSVRDNIALGQAVTDERLQSVISSAHIEEFLPRLSQGMDTLIGDDASGLSVGQAQRVALARALVRDFQLMILDEPTASLDQRSARIVTDAINNETRDKTMITVSHRPESLEQADHIVILNNGRLLAQGSQQELNDSSEIFRKLCQDWEQEVACV